MPVAHVKFLVNDGQSPPAWMPAGRCAMENYSSRPGGASLIVDIVVPPNAYWMALLTPFTARPLPSTALTVIVSVSPTCAEIAVGSVKIRAAGSDIVRVRGKLCTPSAEACRIVTPGDIAVTTPLLSNNIETVPVRCQSRT
jgi:hypothetical protein